MDNHKAGFRISSKLEDPINRGIIDMIFMPPPPATPLQQIRAIVLAATCLLLSTAVAACCVVGFAVIARAFVRQVIG